VVEEGGGAVQKEDVGVGQDHASDADDLPRGEGQVSACSKRRRWRTGDVGGGAGRRRGGEVEGGRGFN
jgi:hypothetical protein